MEKTFSEKIVWSNDLADVFDKYAVELDSLHLREKHAFRGADFQYCVDDCVDGNRYGLFAYTGNVAYALQSSGKSRMYISQHDLDRGNGDEILGFFADSEAEACERAEHALRHYCEIVEDKSLNAEEVNEGGKELRQLKEKLELQGKEIEELKAQIKNCLTKGTTFGEMFRNP